MKVVRLRRPLANDAKVAKEQLFTGCPDLLVAALSSSMAVAEETETGLKQRVKRILYTSKTRLLIICPIAIA